MTENEMNWFRNPALMSPHDTAVVIVDLQEKLLPAMADGPAIGKRAQLLVRGCQLLEIPVLVSQQYPKGLGQTIPELQALLADRPAVATVDKTMFSVRACEQAFGVLAERGVRNLVLAGIETHVCVVQSALDLLANGFEVHVCVDAVGSRKALDHQTALRRLESAGVSLTTVEATLFELCEDANHESFRLLSKSLK